MSELLRNIFPESKKKVLINHTNHPYEKWSDKQKEETMKEYDKVTDIRFPLILPHAGDFMLMDDLKGNLEFIARKYKPSETDVLISGEMVYTYRMVDALKRLGYRCIAATTERKVVETQNDDGSTTKTSVFEFVKYREY